MRLRTVGRVKGFPTELASLGLAGWPAEKPASPPAARAVLTPPSPVLLVCHPVCAGLSPEAVPCHTPREEGSSSVLLLQGAMLLCSGERALLCEDLLLTAFCQLFLLFWDQ